MAALEGGQAAGGDRRGQQSAALIVVKKDAGVWLNNDVVFRLQVDDNPEPIKELRRLVEKALGSRTAGALLQALTRPITQLQCPGCFVRSLSPYASWLPVESPSRSGPRSGNAIQQFVKVDAPVVAITHVRVIDGTGAPAKDDQTVVIRDGNIAAVGTDVAVPADATVIDGTGKSLIPGLVMLHEHTYYPTGPNVYGQLGQSFTRLYLAGGVTTMRTGGNVNGVMDITLAKRAAAFEIAAPAIDATAPYLNGPNTFLQMHSLKDADDARRQVAYWADMGATSFKAYMQITRAELGAAIEEAHKRGLKVTGHLCSVTYAEAAALGIDNLEHGFAASTDFVADKKPDACPGQGAGQQTIAQLDPAAPAVQAVGEDPRREEGRTDVHTDGVRDVHARPPDVARRRSAYAGV